MLAMWAPQTGRLSTGLELRRHGAHPCMAADEPRRPIARSMRFGLRGSLPVVEVTREHSDDVL